MNLTTENNMKGTLESSYAQELGKCDVQKEDHGMHGVDSVNPTQEICEISQGKVAQAPEEDNTPHKYMPIPGNQDTIMVHFPKVTCQPTKDISEISLAKVSQAPEEDNTPRKYVPLPGNQDTIMVHFPKVTCKPTILSNSTNQLNNIAQQYGSKEDVDTETTHVIEDSQNANNVLAADPSLDNMHSSNIDVSNNLNETSFLPIVNSSNILLDTDGNMNQIVYQQTFSGTNITSVIEASASGIKSPNKTHTAGVDEADNKSSSAILNQSNTESTSNDVDKSSEITESTSNDADKSTEIKESTSNDADKSTERMGSSEQNTTSTNIESTTTSNAQDIGTNNSESGEHTPKEDNENDDKDNPEPSHDEVDNSEPEISDAENNAEVTNGLNEEDLLGSQSDNPKTQIDLEWERALLAESSSNSADEMSEESGSKKKKALLSPKACNRKRKHPNVNVISSDGKYYITLILNPQESIYRIIFVINLYEM